MNQKSEQLAEILKNERFPLSGKYDPVWVLENQMGPNPLWLTEWLCKEMDLEPGMRVLDMGCGKGLSSVFLAKEFGVKVWATDLWVSASDNWQRIQEAGVQDRVFPIHAEARSLPYAHGFFDAIVCIDSYIYYGTDDLYLDYFHKFVKPGGRIGTVMPGFMQGLSGHLPQHLRPFWAQECWTWHTVDWWRDHWERTGLVEIEVADRMPNGAQVWLQHYKAVVAAGDDRESKREDIRVLESDGGEFMGFIRMIARRNEHPPKGACL